MKKLLFASVMMFMSVGVFADTPPVPGTTVTDKIEGAAAQILYDSLAEKDGVLPPEYSFTTKCGEVNSGKLHETKADGRPVTIACQLYYCFGHKAVCNLKEQY